MPRKEAITMIPNDEQCWICSQSERDKVLDELDTWVQSQIDGAGDDGDYVVQSVLTDVQIKIESLRMYPSQEP